MSVPVRGFLKRRRDRAMGTIMGWIERNLQEALTPEQFKALRDTVQGAINSYHDSTLDLMSAEEDVVRNDRVVEVLEAVELELQRGRRSASVHSVG